jgi:hypothetical protein
MADAVDRLRFSRPRATVCPASDAPVKGDATIA